MTQPFLIGKIPAYTYTGVYTTQRQTAVVVIGSIGLTLLVIGVIASLSGLSLPSGGSSFLVASGTIIIVVDIIALLALYFKNRIACEVLEGCLKKLQTDNKVFFDEFDKRKQFVVNKGLDFAKERYLIYYEFQEKTEISFFKFIEGSRFFSFLLHSNKHKVHVGLSAELENSVYVVQVILNGDQSLHFFLCSGEKAEFAYELLTGQSFNEKAKPFEISVPTINEADAATREFNSEKELEGSENVSEQEWDEDPSLTPQQTGHSDHEEN